jgi:uncharacterized protein (DUF1330 family)
MAAYVVSEVEARDEQEIERYQVVEGGPPPKALVIVEFPSMQHVRKWYASNECAEALKVRRTALARRLIFADGLPVV